MTGWFVPAVQDELPLFPTTALPTPPHLRCPHSPLVVWFTEPLGMLTQLVEPAHGTAAMAEFITGTAWSALQELRGDRAERLLFIHDFSLMDTYDGEARRLLTMWGLSIRRDIDRIVVVQPPVKNRIARMGIAAAATALDMLGVQIELDEVLPVILDRYSVRPLARSGA